ncbi:MAG: CHASE2 domain-containing protein [Planctomycetota bacterium]|nr:CHASE2 domain-containing protein [Planctomycetota bacterium]
MARLESRLYVRSIIIGVLVTLIVLSFDSLGMLDSLEYWLYDARAAHCQLTTPAPTTQIAHLDIDDPSLETIGRWPWPRETLAQILDEVQRTHPSAIALDILFSEPQQPRLVQDPDGKLRTIDDDAELAKIMRKSGNAVLPASFRLESADARSPELIAAIGWLTQNLELTRAEFTKKARAAGWNQQNGAAIDNFLIPARRAAMLARIDQELDRAPLSREQLIARLLPHTSPDVHSAIIRVLEDQYAVCRATHGIQRFSATMQTLAPLHGVLDAVPAPIFSDAAAGCAFVNYDIFDNATVRSIPLFVEYKKRLYPQMGLETACVMLKADPSKVRFDGSNVIIPAPGRDITIPTYIYRSKTLGLEVPLIAAVPWFGGREWETMYDWPAHRSSAVHLSLANIWNIRLAVQQIAKNSVAIDTAISHILNDDRPDKLACDPALARKYAASPPDLQDTTAREKMATLTLAALNSAGWLDRYKQLAEKDLSPEDKLQRADLYDAVDALRNAVPQSAQLREQIDLQRSELAAQIGGKGVLIGFTATGFQDKVNTSLHLHCPGVVVHGVIANAVLTGRWWRMAPDWVIFLLTIVLAMTTAFAQGRLLPVRGTLLALGLLVGYLLINGFVLFGWQQLIVGVAGPAVAIVCVWAACTLDREILEGIERNRIATEVALFSQEMELARNVQVALIPTAPPQVKGLQVEGWALAASLTGGDCYDFWVQRDGRLAILLADASGHGLAPAMIVSQVRTLVRTLSDFETHPRDLLARVNDRLSEDLEGNRFVTAFLGFLSADGKLDWASAGHGPMFWSPTNNRKMITLTATGLPLGIQTDWLADPAGPPLQLEHAGMLAVFSDGLFEAPAPGGEQFSVERVEQILCDNCNQPCAHIIAELRSAVQKWQGKIEPIDDQTIIIVRRVGL